jgi:hypothetical protein
VIPAGDNEIIMPQADPGANATANAAAPAPALNLAPDGLTLVLEGGATRQAPFGLPRGTVLPMVAAVLGAPLDEGDNQECGAGPLAFASFAGGLGLYFQNGKFAGWDLDGREGGKFTTGAGIGIGSTLQQLRAAGPVPVADSSLGIEFHAGAISGLLSGRGPTAEVTNLWAGVNCIAR